MRRQADRYTLNLPAEVFVEGHRHLVELHDLSRSGMFLRLPTPLRVGTKLHVAIAPEGARRVTTATVSHALGEADAHALGRSPGVGIAFREPLEATDHLFAITVDRLVRQWRVRAAPPPAVVLRGSLAAIGLPALLTMLEHERKTGRIELVADHTAWIDLVDGRIVNASSSARAGDLRSTILSLLDWTHGTFTLAPAVGPHDDAERVLPITYLLLEHARLTDEARASLS